jgi:hypothetical protein
MAAVLTSLDKFFLGDHWSLSSDFTHHAVFVIGRLSFFKIIPKISCLDDELTVCWKRSAGLADKPSCQT